MKTYTFPFFDLVKRFKKNNYTNPITGDQFTPVFVQEILQGSVKKDRTKWNRLDGRLGICQNPQDVKNEPAANVVYYKDRSDGHIYCFAITKLFAQFMKNDYVNYRTGRKFSKKFRKKFEQLYNVDLHKGGLLQEQFREWYGDEAIPPGLQYQEDAARPSEEIDAVSMEQERPVQLIVPDIWQLVVGAVEEEERELRGEESVESASQESVKTADSAEEEPSSVSQESAESAESVPQESASKESAESAVSKDSAESADSAGSANQSSTASFGMGGGKCKLCNKSASGLRTKMYDPKQSSDVNFCSIKCFEDYDWPKFKSGKKKRRKRK
jgi:hypothetical protein